MNGQRTCPRLLARPAVLGATAWVHAPARAAKKVPERQPFIDSKQTPISWFRHKAMEPSIWQPCWVRL